MSRLLIPFLVASLADNASALHLRIYSAARHERFSSFGNIPVNNPAFMHAGVDLSGVGWDAGYAVRQVTLISPQHFVCANHFRPPVGGELRFLSAAGVLRTATTHSVTAIQNSSGQATDLLIGRLTAPMAQDSGVRFLPCHLLDTETAYLGQTLGVLGQLGRGGRGVIGGFSDFGGDPITGGSGINSTRALHFTYNSLTGSEDDAYAESGDSGSPSFVVVNNQAAVTGIHTAVLTALGTVTTFDSFLPAYVTPINAVLASDGFHLTAAAPKTTTLSLAQQVTPAVVRAGYPVTLTFTLSNTGPTAAANNVRLGAALNTTDALQAAGAAGWVFIAGNGTVQARRGGLPAGAATTVTLTFTPSAAGTVSRTLTWSADETAAAAASADLIVRESFRSWASALMDKTATGDDDRDRQDNLSEYAFGGDPHIASTKVAGTAEEQALIAVRRELVSGGSRQVVRWVRRTDAAQRGLDYRLEVSSTTAEGWNDVTASSQVLSTTPLPSDFEAVEMALPPTATARQFARIRVFLTE